MKGLGRSRSAGVWGTVFPRHVELDTGGGLVNRQNLRTILCKCGTACPAISSIQRLSPVASLASTHPERRLVAFEHRHLVDRGPYAPQHGGHSGGCWCGCYWGALRPTVSQLRNALPVGRWMLVGGMRRPGVAWQTIGSGLVATGRALMPTLVRSWRRLWGKRPARLEWAGMAVGLCGLALSGTGRQFQRLYGWFAGHGGATLSWSLGLVLPPTRRPLAAGSMGFASKMLCIGAVLMQISLALGEQCPWLPQAMAAAAWACLVVFGSRIAFNAYVYLLAHTSSVLATRYAFVSPETALFLGTVLAEKIVRWGEWIPSGIIPVGVLLIMAAKCQQEKKPPALAHCVSQGLPPDHKIVEKTLFFTGAVAIFTVASGLSVRQQSRRQVN